MQLSKILTITSMLVATHAFAGDSSYYAGANYFLGTYSESEEGLMLLSPELMTDHEVDETVDQLKSELEEFRRRAKQELHNLRAKMRHTWEHPTPMA